MKKEKAVRSGRGVVGYYHIKKVNKQWLQTFAKGYGMKASPALDTVLDALRGSKAVTKAIGKRITVKKEIPTAKAA